MKATKIDDPQMRLAHRQVMRARRRTALGQLEDLLRERSKWQRRATIAASKLAAAQRALDAHALRMAEARFAHDLTSTAP